MKWAGNSAISWRGAAKTTQRGVYRRHGCALGNVTVLRLSSRGAKRTSKPAGREPYPPGGVAETAGENNRPK